MKPRKGICWGVLAVAFSLSSAIAYAEVDVGAIQKALAQKNAGWTAKESWVTRLSQAEIKRILGAPMPDANDSGFAPVETESKAAAAIDWRNKDGVNWVTPMLNQGNCGSCVAFAAVATLETQLNITSGIPGLNPAFSTQALFACGGGSCDIGWQVGPAARYLQSKGVPDEACAPYTMGATGDDVACGQATCADASSRTTKISGSSTPSSGFPQVSAVKAALAKGPLVTTLTVYTDFLAYSSGIYKHVSGKKEGGHAVSIVGYDDEKKAWLIRNSWSTDWGMNGFGWVAYDDISGLANSTWAFAVAKKPGYVFLTNPTARSYFSGSAMLSAKSTFPATASLEYSLVQSKGGRDQVVRIGDCSGSDCISALDTGTLQDGAYQLFATAKSATGVLGKSEHEQLFIANADPKLKLTYSFTGGVNPSQPLSGRPVLAVKTDTGIGGVPMSRVAFHVVQNGQEIFTRESLIILPDMTFGWRTTTLPNGKYDIFFTGELVTAQGKSTTMETQHLSVTVRN